MTMSRLMIALRSGLAFAVCAVAGTLASVALAAPAVTTANVNLRQGPSTDYQIIVTVPASAAVDVEGCASGWCKVDYAGSAGWISEDYLQGLSNPPVSRATFTLEDEPDLGAASRDVCAESVNEVNFESGRGGKQRRRGVYPRRAVNQIGLPFKKRSTSLLP